MSPAQHFDVAIVGGGIVGTSAALALRRLGKSVLVMERDVCGSRSSGVNYGGVRRQGRSLVQLPLSQRAHVIWGRLPELIGTDGEYIRSGHLKIARTEADLASLQAYRDKSQAHGLDLQIIGGDALRKTYPWLGERVLGGSLCAEDGHANPRLVSPAFARAAHLVRRRWPRQPSAGFACFCQGGASCRGGGHGEHHSQGHPPLRPSL